MSYSVEDFSECVARVAGDTGRIARTEITRVVAAWGKGTGIGVDAPGFTFGESATDWHGGFVCALADGRYAYITGWCDYTGWG